MPDITDFFDVLNKTHMKAYVHLETKGSWPEGFLPAGITSDPLWHVQLAAKMANAWKDAIMHDQVVLDIVEFFDPTKREHAEAFVHLRDSGRWPENFLPKNIKFSYQWNLGVMAKGNNLTYRL